MNIGQKSSVSFRSIKILYDFYLITCQKFYIMCKKVREDPNNKQFGRPLNIR